MKIDGFEYTLLKDYDTGKYKHLTFEGKVTYLDERVQMILIIPCQRAMQTELQTDIGLILTTAICAGISAAGTFLTGRQAQKKGEDRKFFTAFVGTYMELRKVTPSPKKGWADWLYRDLRCGLAHNFAVLSGGIEYEAKGYVETKPYGLELNPTEFLEDFARAWSKYLGDVRKFGKDKGLGQKFEHRFDQIFHD